MTSTVSRENVEDQLRAAGIRTPQQLARVMRVIDLYALAVARRVNAEHHPQYAAMPDLQPGEYDPARAVICCKECGIIKHFLLFPKDKTAPHGRSPVCKHCIDPPLAVNPAHDPDQLIKCKTCGDTLRAEGNFYVRKDNTTGYALSCKDCISGTKMCPGCGRKRLARKYVQGSPLCAVCRIGIGVFT